MAAPVEAFPQVVAVLGSRCGAGAAPGLAVRWLWSSSALSCGLGPTVLGWIPGFVVGDSM